PALAAAAAVDVSAQRSPGFVRLGRHAHDDEPAAADRRQTLYLLRWLVGPTRCETARREDDGDRPGNAASRGIRVRGWRRGRRNTGHAAAVVYGPRTASECGGAAGRRDSRIGAGHRFQAYRRL